MSRSPRYQALGGLVPNQPESPGGGWGGHDSARTGWAALVLGAVMVSGGGVFMNLFHLVQTMGGLWMSAHGAPFFPLLRLPGCVNTGRRGERHREGPRQPRPRVRCVRSELGAHSTMKRAGEEEKH